MPANVFHHLSLTRNLIPGPKARAALLALRGAKRQLLINGVPIHQAMKLARHHSIEMTQRYTKVRQDEAVAAFSKLPPAPISGQWKSQSLKGNESPIVSRTVPKKAARRRAAKSSQLALVSLVAVHGGIGSRDGAAWFVK